MALQNAFGNLALDATLTGGNAVSNIWNSEISATGAITGSGQTVVLPERQAPSPVLRVRQGPRAPPDLPVLLGLRA